MLDLKALKVTLGQLEEERKIPQADIIAALEQALAAAYKKDFGKRGQIVRAMLDMETGEMQFEQVKIVVDETLAKMPEEFEETDEEAAAAQSEDATADADADGDDRYRFDPEKHILIEDARKIKADVELEEEMVFPLEPKDDFGRIAAQTAKQVIIQRIREAEKVSIMSEYEDRVGTLVKGTIQKIEGSYIFVDFQRATGILPKSEQIPGEFYRQGQRIQAYLVSMEETNRSVHLKLSRTHPLLIEELFALESPEIASGTVEIKAIAREPGSRSKMAVTSHDENVDPIGACVGQKGIRVTTVMSELGGEKIDIIPWAEDALDYVANSLSPARILGIELDEEGKTAHVEVAEDQLSLAIGKGGQNVRLAAKLTGWRIDIQGINEDGEAPVEVEEETQPSTNAEEVAEEAEEAQAEAPEEMTNEETVVEEASTEEVATKQAESEAEEVKDSLDEQAEA